jgi:hypothetical protein
MEYLHNFILLICLKNKPISSTKIIRLQLQLQLQLTFPRNLIFV